MSEDGHIENDHYIVELNIDADSLPVTNVEMQHERRVAIFDLLEENEFRPLESEKGPYLVNLALRDGSRLDFDVKRSTGMDIGTYTLSMTPFRRIVKDYFLICESYYDAIRTSSPSQIEAIDMGRRGLHNEGSQTLSDRLDGKIEIDFDTARRLFTLICVLHWRG